MESCAHLYKNIFAAAGNCSRKRKGRKKEDGRGYTDAEGCFDRTNKEIILKKGMGRLQEVKTFLHEIRHAMLYAGGNPEKDSRTCEVESTAFVVCKRLGLDTGDYSFPYIARWLSGKEMEELLGATATIQRTADRLITEIERRIVK